MSGGRVLVTGFGPFPGAPVNPTAFLIEDLRRTGLTQIVPHLLPVTWAGTGPTLTRLIGEVQPDAVLLFGLARRSRVLRVEMRAVNAATQAGPDADGIVAAIPRLDADGPDARPTRCDGPALLAALRAAGLRARLSRDAGTYLCNAALWTALAATGPAIPVALIHVPPLPARRTWYGPASLLRAAQVAIEALRLPTG